MDMSDGVRKLIMAGIGAASVAAEKSQDTIDALAQKGERAVKEGKVLNERLRYGVKKAAEDRDTEPEKKPLDKDGVLSALRALSEDDRKLVLDSIKSDPQSSDGE